MNLGCTNTNNQQQRNAECDLVHWHGLCLSELGVQAGMGTILLENKRAILDERPQYMATATKSQLVTVAQNEMKKFQFNLRDSEIQFQFYSILQANQGVRSPCLVRSTIYSSPILFSPLPERKAFSCRTTMQTGIITNQI